LNLSVRRARGKAAATLVAVSLVLIPPYAARAGGSHGAGGSTASYHRVATMTGPNIPPMGRWSFDISGVDQSSERYVLADTGNNSLDIFDARTLRFISAVQGLPGPSGLTLDDQGFAWVAGGDNAVRVINVATAVLETTIQWQGSGGADELAFDPTHHLVLVTNPRENPPDPPFLTVISTVTRKVVGSIPLPDAGPLSEQPVWDVGSQRFLIPTEEPATDLAGGAIAELLYADPVSMQVTRRVPIGTCLPTGAAKGPGREMLVSCPASGAIIVNVDSGQVVSIIDGQPGGDQVAYDPIANTYYLAAGLSATPTLVVVNAHTHTVIATPPTGVMAHSVAASWALGRIFVPIMGQGIAVFERSP
jgi:DNA-binding beta-propeller fold protein YncE